MGDEGNRISEVFRDKIAFISGASGFLGKVLIEKLLRTTDVKKLHLLIRTKKGKTPENRLQDMFNHPLFAMLNELRPDAIKKCHVVPGDVLETNLGIVEEDRQLLCKEVDFIFHSAATTRFDDTIKYAVQMNTRGTKFMLDLAKQCEKLKCFVHVSTAYAFPKEDVLYEKAYDPPADPDEVLNSVNWIREDSMADLTKQILGDIPNSYTFSKALAEGLVNKEVGKLPVIIVRPAVVIPIFQDPLPGFFNNLQSPMGIFIGAGKGVIRSMYMDSKSYANLIPADCTINIMLVAVWDYLNTGKKNVFNACVPETDIKVNWEEIIELGKEVINTQVPFNNIMWYPGGTMTKNRPWHLINVFLFQLMPAVFIDALLLVLGYKPLLYDINKRLFKGQEMFEYYTTKAWDFNLEYFLSLRKKLTAEEKAVYKVEADGVDLKAYLRDCVMYSRRHIFHETDDMLPAAKRNMKIYFILDRIVKIGFFVILFYYFYRIVFGST
ncbi:putative fatty acyl-CoA reductase CG5065 isoform X1 [Cylas formicarius]|nr:putative fatty acyl-CoA reductase CG5065 isoform X1 [Cylas formicarius]